MVTSFGMWLGWDAGGEMFSHFFDFLYDVDVGYGKRKSSFNAENIYNFILHSIDYTANGKATKDMLKFRITKVRFHGDFLVSSTPV